MNNSIDKTCYKMNLQEYKSYQAGQDRNSSLWASFVLPLLILDPKGCFSILQQLLSEPERSVFFVFALGVFMVYKLTKLHLEPNFYICSILCPAIEVENAGFLITRTELDVLSALLLQSVVRPGDLPSLPALIYFLFFIFFGNKMRQMT